MSELLARLTTEKSELDEKKAKLEAFLKSEAFNSISNAQKSLLNIQLSAMATYSQCLTERLYWFNNVTN